MTSPIRAFQDRVTDHGWRIQWISPAQSSRPIVVMGNPITLLGAFGFIAGITLFVKTRDPLWVALLSVPAFVLMCGSHLLLARRRRATWVRVPARCLDRELRQAMANGEAVWAFRLLCEFEYNELTYRVTPTHWRQFTVQPLAPDKGKGVAEKELDRLVDSDGVCWLHINPDNPTETELASRDIAEALLHD